MSPVNHVIKPLVKCFKMFEPKFNIPCPIPRKRFFKKPYGIKNDCFYRLNQNLVINSLAYFFRFQNGLYYTNYCIHGQSHKSSVSSLHFFYSFVYTFQAFSVSISQNDLLAHLFCYQHPVSSPLNFTWIFFAASLPIS